MKSKSLSIALLTSLSIVPLASNIAYANSYCMNSVSYMVLPNGKCVDLKYMPIASASRQKLGQATKEFLNALESVATDGKSTTSTVGSGRTWSSTTVTEYDSKEERQAKKAYADTKGQDYGKAAVTNNDVEQWAFKQHVKSLNAVSGALATPMKRSRP
jgi:hypothetical protein